jgi:apolipoprotein N-acyltransferase
MDAHTLGNLAGRLLMSALLVYIMLLCFNRLKLKTALIKMKRPLAIIGTLLLFTLGMAGHAVADERAKRPFAVTAIPVAGLQIYIPDRPAWQAEASRWGY